MTELEGWIEERVRGRRVAVVGVGNRLRGDDGAGSQVGERLRAQCPAPVFDAGTVPENFLGVLIEFDPEVVVFVDAADHGGTPGSCCVAPPAALAARHASTHAPSLRLLAQILEARGIDCWLLGIQPASTAPGTELSPAVAAGVGAAAAALASVLARETHHA
jgi:hydrogenase 3 maturation protease